MKILSQKWKERGVRDHVHFLFKSLLSDRCPLSMMDSATHPSTSINHEGQTNCWKNDSSDSEDLNDDFDVTSWIDSSMLPETSVGVKRTLEVIDPNPPPPQTTKRRKASKTEKDPVERTTGGHTPSINRPKDGKDHRKRCRVCKARKTDLICFECNAPLCVSGYGTQNCWFIYHNCQTISKPEPLVELS